MRSYIRTNASLQPRREAPEVRRFAPHGAREIALCELVAALEVEPPMLHAISTSHGFPPPIGKRYHGERVWLLADVADYFDRIGWPEDARALREWGG